MSMSRFLNTLLVSGCLILSGCSSNTDDLKDWVEKVKARPTGPIAPIPEVKQSPSFVYSASNMRSPFADLEPDFETKLQDIANDNCDTTIRPDSQRRPEELERFSLDSLEMVGAIFTDIESYGLVRTTTGPSKGNVYKVTLDNYLGVNHGRVVDINEFRIVIETLIPDSQGCWEKQIINLALNE